MKTDEILIENWKKPTIFCLFFLYFSFFCSFLFYKGFFSYSYKLCEVKMDIPENRCYLEGIVFPKMVSPIFAMPSAGKMTSFRRMSADLSGDGSTGHIPVGISAYPQLLLATLLVKSRHDALESPGSIFPESCASAFIVAALHIASADSAANLQHIFQTTKYPFHPHFTPFPEKCLQHRPAIRTFSRPYHPFRENHVFSQPTNPQSYIINHIVT